MSTYQDIVNRAGRLLSVVNSGESLTTTESNDALTALNAMFSSWNNERLMAYSMQEETIPMVANQSSYSIGPSGADLVTTRPVEIEKAYILYSNISYPVRIMDEEAYALLPAKTTASTWPDHINYLPTMPNGTIRVYPVPNASSSLKIVTRVPLGAVALTDTVSLPPGWEEAAAANLALVIAPEYQVQPSQLVVSMAQTSKANIKRINSRPIMLGQELTLMFSHQRAHIISDQP